MRGHPSSRYIWFRMGRGWVGALRTLSGPLRPRKLSFLARAQIPLNWLVDQTEGTQPGGNPPTQGDWSRFTRHGLLRCTDDKGGHESCIYCMNCTTCTSPNNIHRRRTALVVGAIPVSLIGHVRLPVVRLRLAKSVLVQEIEDDDESDGGDAQVDCRGHMQSGWSGQMTAVSGAIDFLEEWKGEGVRE